MGKEEETIDLRTGRPPQNREVRGAGPPCDACGSEMKPMGHCKYWCLKCGFLRTCNDVI